MKQSTKLVDILEIYNINKEGEETSDERIDILKQHESEIIEFIEKYSQDPDFLDQLADVYRRAADHIDMGMAGEG